MRVARDFERDRKQFNRSGFPDVACNLQRSQRPELKFDIAKRDFRHLEPEPNLEYGQRELYVRSERGTMRVCRGIERHRKQFDRSGFPGNADYLQRRNCSELKLNFAKRDFRHLEPEPDLEHC